MSGPRLLFVIAGAIAMLAGGTALLRPAVARRLLGLPDHEGTVYALRIGGMMAASFGLVLVAFVVTFATAPGAGQ